jgi:DNA-binding transcriptional ArsR family regulator
MESALKALAHPDRQALLRHLMKGEQTTGGLAKKAHLRQPATSQHLKVLRDANLVHVRGDGNKRVYRVDVIELQKLRTKLDAFWGGSLDALKTAAEKKHRGK